MALYAVRLERGGPWDWSRDMREQVGWDEHARFMDGLVESGFILLGGPLENGRDTLHIVEAEAEAAIRARRAASGDLVVSLARLRADREAGLHLVGALEVEDVLADVTTEPGPGWWDSNAHVRRARATRAWDSFWVFRGSPRSRLFECAVPFTL